MCDILRNILRTTCFVKRTFYGQNINLLSKRYLWQSTLKLSTFENEDTANTPRKQLSNKSVTVKTKQKTASWLIHTFDLKPTEAFSIISSCREICHTPSSLILYNYDICLDNNLDKKLIFAHPFVLCDEKLTDKITKLQALPLELECTLPFLKFRKQRLSSMVQDKEKWIQKINAICELLNISKKEACQALAIKTFLFRKPISYLQASLNILIEYGFKHEDIIKDLWVLKYSEFHIKYRLDFMKKVGIVNKKPWMIRCQEKQLYGHLKKVTDKDILGKNSLTEYLSQKLQCSENTAKIIITKHPQLQRKRLSKINIIFELLDKKGFKPALISQVPKILLHSPTTIEERLNKLASILGKNPDSLYMVTKSQKQYLQHLDHLVKSKVKEQGNM